MPSLHSSEGKLNTIFDNLKDNITELDKIFERDNKIPSYDFDERLFIKNREIVGNTAKLTSVPVYQLPPPKFQFNNEVRYFQ